MIVTQGTAIALGHSRRVTSSTGLGVPKNRLRPVGRQGLAQAGVALVRDLEIRRFSSSLGAAPLGPVWRSS